MRAGRGVVQYGLLLALMGTLAADSFAAVVEWDGGDGDYLVASNWVGGVVPDLAASGDTALIRGGDAVYYAGPDLMIGGGSTLQISGGSWTQTNGISWIQLGGGNLLIDGGTFNQGTAGNIVRNADSSISVTAGMANFAGNFIVATNFGSFAVSGAGTVNVENELKVNNDFAVSGGTLTCSLISFADGTGSLLLSGGQVVVDGSGAFSGFYGGGGGKSLDFSGGSAGSLFLANYTLAELSADNFLNNGTITIDGVVNAAAFNPVPQDGGVLISLVSENNTVPTGVNAVGGNETITVSWNAVSGATGYRVKRALSSGGPYALVGQPTEPSFEDVGLSNGSTYYYVVSAIVNGSEGSASYEVSATPAVPVPTGVLAVSGNGTVSLTWAAVTDASGYTVKRALTSGGPYSMVEETDTTAFVDSGLENGTEYFYVITSTIEGVESGPSDEVSSIPSIVPPTGFSAVAGDSQVTLFWNAVTGADSYVVRRSLDAGGPYAEIATPAATSVVDGDVTNGVTYYYVVSTVISGEEGAASAEIPAVPSVPNYYEWAGGDGDYATATNWAGGEVPNLSVANSLAVISAGNVTYNAGPDLQILNGSTLQISGGSWTQTNGISWIQMAGGNLLVDGGVFNQGTAGNMVRDANSSITVTAGTANLSGIYVSQASSGSLEISGSGEVNIGTEFQPVDDFYLTGGTLSCSLVSFAAGTGSVHLVSGRFEVDGSGGFSGLYGAGGGRGINFPTNSSAVLFFENYTTAELTSDAFLSNGSVLLDGSVNRSAFSAVEVDGGVEVSVLVGSGTAPGGLAAAGDDGQVALSWNGVGGALSYNVKRALVSGGPYATIGSPTTTAWVDTTAVNGTAYYYVVSFVGDEGESINSSEVMAIPSSAVAPGESFMAILSGAGSDEVVLATGSNTVKGHVYQLLVTDSLTAPDWQPAGDAVEGDGSMLVVTVPVDEQAAQRYYKLEVQRL
ncbi:MAG: hypothetical protein JXR25_10670 [Pontiellaceae bacterium]|nr:hypothetical protein [Pontiellaceae bacterium]MBN2785283.1 hypothetical protein [Pontiellaceae bacterium]